MLAAAQTSSPQSYDCFVLSGGGAKGAYGAGVAKAIFAYRHLKNRNNPICFIGASAGALNAYLLASQGVDALIKFWTEVTNASILDVYITNAKFQGALHWATNWGRTPYSVYPNSGLRKLIGDHARLGDVESPLIIAATDYTKAELKAFYVSPLIDKLVEDDANRPIRERRLNHFRRLDTDEALANALLASAAIPVFFPPVEITTSHNGNSETGWYIDGGVGNHTPTREAGYFFRYIESLKLGTPGIVYCIKQDPPRALVNAREALGAGDILMRTLEVYHRIHMDPIIRGWFRINNEVERQHERLEHFKTWLASQPLSQSMRDAICDRAKNEFVNLGGRAPRLSAPMIEIEPATKLADSLNFDPVEARKTIERGYSETLLVLRNTKVKQVSLDEAEYVHLKDRRIFEGDP
ncbi:MAG: patatin-like phospholipase family protein [Alphaproteobacteria bacterium]|nr:patatin-like phospholipase family protein [Alphaproteobacteria bacterium]